MCSGRNLTARKQESKKSSIINGQGGLHRKEAYIAYLPKQTKIQSNRMNGWFTTTTTTLRYWRKLVLVG